MKILNESLFSTDSDLVSYDEMDVDAVADPTYADAIENRKKTIKELNKRFKDKEKERDDFVKQNHNIDFKPKTDKELKKLKLSESLFESDDTVKGAVRDFVDNLINSTLDNLSQVVASKVDGYDAEWCDTDGQTAIANKLSQNIDNVVDSIVAVLFAENGELTEATEYTEPEAMGRGTCAPLVFDITRRIQQNLKHLDNEDERARSIAKKDLQVCIDDLMDQKQTVENFNTYWTTRYKASLNFIEAQLNLIPQEFLGEGLTEDAAVLDKPETDIEVDFTPKDNQIYYKRKREPLADIIMNELTSGEVVYKRGSKGNFNPTMAPSLNLPEEDIGADSDENGYYIIAWVPTQEETKAIENIANKYKKEFKTGFNKYNVGNQYYTKIYIDEQDWDVPYFDPNAPIASNKK